jgi:hypothetical protein
MIEGTILEVMESFPLQLTLKTETGRYHVALLEETTITQEGATVESGILRPGMRVRIEGQASALNAMTAQSIEIL